MQKDKNTIEFEPGSFESKWQKAWEDAKIFSPDVKNAKNPYFNLMMFPYPSAEGLHVGNMYAFTGADVYAKFQRMQGKDVLEPIGLDGFGIHSENYAMKVGRHPMEQAQIAEKNFYRQLRSIGNSFDWQRTIETYDPNYYKWTQWLFTLMFRNGLAYRKKAQVNWCPSDKTVLSDEQVIDGKCERCSSLVEKRELEQWFFRITKYADRLLSNLTQIDWAEKVKIAQKQWIGKSEGAQIEFKLAGPAAPHPRTSASASLQASVGGPPVASPVESITVFTTRPDTLFGATFMVIAPEHELAQKSESEEVKRYLQEVKNKTEIERGAEDKEKTGVFSGLYAINPINSKKIPIWIADYVLSGYGTGAIMAVPAHDQRDFDFANKYNLPIIPVIRNKEERITNNELEEAFEGKGEIIGSEEWNGFHAPEDMDKILSSIEAKGIGSRRSNYHLRDWLISRQRYWGPPIPMIYCEACFKDNKGEVKDMAGWYTVPEAELPVLLPDVQDWRPDPSAGSGQEGKVTGPLANHPEFYNAKCPGCGADAKRETDVSDTFLDSAWYFLRYPSTDIESVAFDTDITKKWLPVDMYIGGAEHSVLHLLYARFVTMVLKDLKFIDFEEPFTRFFAHGLIIKDGAKMSKSKGNVVVPDEYIKKYGSDALRTYLMFLGPYEAGGDFSDSGIQGVHRFLKRAWTLITDSRSQIPESEMSSEAKKMMHKTIKRVTNDMGKLSYNTAIAALMEWYNFLSGQRTVDRAQISKEEIENYLKLLAPFAPHMTEELWQLLKADSGQKTAFSSIHLSKWPEFDETLTQDEELVIVVQVNGKRRGEITVSADSVQEKEKVEGMAKEKVAAHLEGIEVKKVIYIQGKIVNFVV